MLETLSAIIRDTHLGRMIMVASDRGVCMVAFGDDDDQIKADVAEYFPTSEIELTDRCEAQAAALACWIGEPDRFLDPAIDWSFPLDVRGTPFQKKVWSELRRIPLGSTISYQELAVRIGQPQAVRAAASACARNKLALIIPCHRVIRSDGTLGGYRWGLERKQNLLAVEKGLRAKNDHPQHESVLPSAFCVASR